MDAAYFKDKLLRLRQETLDSIEKSKDTSKPVELDQTSVGRLSRMDAIQQQNLALAAKRRRHEYLKQIDRALKRIEDGDFGYCTACDEEIAFKRLDLNPVIQSCIQCADGTKNK